MDSKSYLLERREVCWDEALTDKMENVTVKMHKPLRKNVVITLDKPWEGSVSGYFSVLKVGDKYRLYYRGGNWPLTKNEWVEGGYYMHSVFCVAESDDAKSFERIDVSKFKFHEFDKNNIVFSTEEWTPDNFSVCYDENPDCPPDEKFKALAQRNFCPKIPPTIPPSLAYYKSADGINFTFVKYLPFEGAFDSFNLTFWNPVTKKYHLYFRKYHKSNEVGVGDNQQLTPHLDIRDIRVTYSTDFENFTEPERITYSDDYDYQLYTNGIFPYPRAKGTMLGIPTRYINRADYPENFKYIKWLNSEVRQAVIDNGERGGTAFTEAVLITSRDGKKFRRTNEAFLTPGPQNGSNWIYGDRYIAWPPVITKADEEGMPDEISIYTGEGYRTRPVDLVRYTLRLDGFFSWRADFEGGRVLTKPVTFDANSLNINFATSGYGHVRIRICDLDGKPLEGYDSGYMFGDRVDRNVDFENSLADISGKEVRIMFDMKDSDLYSFVFTKE